MVPADSVSGYREDGAPRPELVQTMVSPLAPRWSNGPYIGNEACTQGSNRRAWSMPSGTRSARPCKSDSTFMSPWSSFARPALLEAPKTCELFASCVFSLLTSLLPHSIVRSRLRVQGRLLHAQVQGSHVRYSHVQASTGSAGRNDLGPRAHHALC